MILFEKLPKNLQAQVLTQVAAYPTLNSPHISAQEKKRILFKALYLERIPNRIETTIRALYTYD